MVQRTAIAKGGQRVIINAPTSAQATRIAQELKAGTRAVPRSGRIEISGPPAAAPTARPIGIGLGEGRGLKDIVSGRRAGEVVVIDDSGRRFTFGGNRSEIKRRIETQFNQRIGRRVQDILEQQREVPRAVVPPTPVVLERRPSIREIVTGVPLPPEPVSLERPEVLAAARPGVMVTPEQVPVTPIIEAPPPPPFRPAPTGLTEQQEREIRAAQLLAALPPGRPEDVVARLPRRVSVQRLRAEQLLREGRTIEAIGTGVTGPLERIAGSSLITGDFGEELFSPVQPSVFEEGERRFFSAEAPEVLEAARRPPVSRERPEVLAEARRPRPIAEVPRFPTLEQFSISEADERFGRELIAGGARGITTLFGEVGAREAGLRFEVSERIIPRDVRERVRGIFGIPQFAREEEKRFQTEIGRFLGEVGPVLLPGPPGAVAAGIQILGAERPGEAAPFLVGGAAFRVASKALSLAGKGVALLPKTKAGAAFVSRGFERIGRLGEIGLVTGVGGLTAVGLAEAIGAGPEAAARFRRETGLAFGGFILGERAARPLVKQLFVPTEAALVRELRLKDLPKEERLEFKQHFSVAKKAAEQLRKQPPIVKPLDYSNIQTLSPLAGRIVGRVIRGDPNVIVGGSLSQKAQVPRSIAKKLPTPKDIDLYTLDERALGRRIEQGLKGAGIERVSVLQKKNKVEITVEGKKAIEVHKQSRILQNISEIRGPFETETQFISTTPRGTKVFSIRGQIPRKVIGGFLFSRERDIPQVELLVRAVLTPKQIAAARAKAVRPLIPRIPERLRLGERGFISPGIRVEINLKKVSAKDIIGLREGVRGRRAFIRGRPSGEFFPSQRPIFRPTRIPALIPSQRPVPPRPTPVPAILPSQLAFIAKQFAPSQLPPIKPRPSQPVAPFQEAFAVSQPTRIPTRPSQVPFIRPSQPPFAPTRRPFAPSQPPPTRPSQPPFAPTRRLPPSQLPFRPTRRPPFIPSQPPAPPKRRPPIIPPVKEPILILPMKITPGLAGVKAKRVRGFEGFVKEEPFKEKKFKKVTPRPLPEAQARERGLLVADLTIAQSVRVKPTRQLVKAQPKPLFSRIGKFRPKKGDPNTLVERRMFAIDTFGEAQKLKVSKFLAQERRAKGILGMQFIKPRKTTGKRTRERQRRLRNERKKFRRG